MKVYLVGQIDPTDAIKVFIDSHSVLVSVGTVSAGTQTLDCSQYFMIVGESPHSATSVTLKIAPTLSASYIAFRDVVLLMDGSPVTTMSSCIKIENGLSYTPDGICTCSSLSTYSSSGNCLSCPTTCGGCSDSGGACYSCRSTSWSGSACVGDPSNCEFSVPGLGCFYCSSGFILAADYTCVQACPAGYNTNSVGDYSVCEATTNSTTPTLCGSDPTKPYYFTEDQTCVETCDYPFVVQEGDVCTLGISADEAKSIEDKASLQNTVANVLGGVAVVSYLLSFADPSGACLSNMVKLLPYMKFMKIAFPPRLYLLLSLQKTDQGSTKFVPAPSDSIIGSFDYYAIPYKFAKYKLYSSFLVNFWSYLMTLLIILGVVLIIFLLDFFTKSLKNVNSAISAAKQAVKWNFTIMFFLGYFDLLIIFTSLELRTLHVDTFLGTLSFIICVTINIAAMIIVYKSFEVIFTLQKLKRLETNGDASNKSGDLDQYEILFKISKDATYSQHLFMAIFIIRTYLFSLIIGYLFDHPLAQAILIILLNIGMLMYLIIKTPLKLKVKLAQFIFQEIMVFIVNLCILILACLDEADSESASFRATIGDIIIMTNIVYNFLAIIFIILVGSVNVYQAYQDHKNKKKSVNMAANKSNLEEAGSDMISGSNQSMIKIHRPRDVDHHFMSNRGDFLSSPPQRNNFQHQQHSIETQGNNSPIMKSYGSPPQRPLDHHHWNQQGHGDFLAQGANASRRKISEAQTVDNSFTLNGSQFPLNNDEWNNGQNNEANISVGVFQSAHIIGKIF